MDYSPPSLSRSPVSSPNTCSPESAPCDYPSPDLVDSHYKLSSVYDDVCGMGSNMEQVTSLPPLDAMTSAYWNGSTLVQPSPSAGIPNILSVEYDAFAAYEPSLHPPYSHDACPHVAHAPGHPISHGPQHMHRTLSHSPDPAYRHSMPYSRRSSGSPQIKAEADYPNDVETSEYPSPHSVHAMPLEVGNYGSAPSSGYLSDVPSGTWLKPEYPPLQPQLPPSSLIAGDAHEHRRTYRSQRAGRRQPRRLTTKDEANFQCKVKGCGKLFSRSYNYKAHLDTHEENREYPFPCPVKHCSKRFVRKTDLTRHHGSVHLKEKNHRCEYCGRMFARKDTLRRHMEDGCSKRFDISPIGFRSEGYESADTRAHLGPSNHLPPLAISQPRCSPNPNVLAPMTRQLRRL